MDDLAVINSFLEDIKCLEPVSQALDKINIFEVLGTSHTEIRHSNMLAWLMDPRKNHGLGDSVLRGIIRLAAGDAPKDCSGFEIHREWNHIDLLAHSEAEKFIVCIENKTYSGEHGNQLERYRQHVESTFPGYRKVYLFLTRKGHVSSDPDHWTAVSYRDVLKIIGEARKAAELKPEVSLILDHYADAVTEMTGGDDHFKNLCGEIWQKHRKAIELIMENGAEEPDDGSAPTEVQRLCGEILQKYSREMQEIRRCRPGKPAEPITDMIRLWAEIKTQDDVIRLRPENTTDRYFRFTTRVISDILPDAVGRRSGWNTENFYFYELRNIRRSAEHEVFLELCVCKKDIPEDLMKASDRIGRIMPIAYDTKMFRGHFATKQHIFIKDNSDEETVMDQLDGLLDQMLEFERQLTKGLQNE